jgi:two-component system sensor histidine kinase UhpB
MLQQPALLDCRPATTPRRCVLAVSALPRPFPRDVLLGATDAGLSAEALITVDARQRIVMVNPAALRMFGCTAPGMLGADFARFIPQRFRSGHQLHTQDFLAFGDTECSEIARKTMLGLRVNGEEFPMAVTISRIEATSDLGPGQFVIAHLLDLSQQPGLPAQLTTRLRSIIDLAPIALWIIEGEQIVFVNRACATLFGAINHQQLLGQSIFALLAPDSPLRVQQGIAQALANNSAAPRVAERITRLDGTVREVEIALIALPDHGNTTLQMLISDVTEQVRMERDLQSSRRDLRRFTANLVEAREAERRHIARELHDELGQRLWVLKMALATAADPATLGPPTEHLASMIEMIDETAVAVRRIAADLRPAMLDDLGLNAAVEWLVKDWSRRMAVSVGLRLAPEDPPIGDSASTALYRMVQEALTNIARHSQASRVTVTMRCQADLVKLTVQDNGVGLSAAHAVRAGAHGWLGMRERCQMLGGHIEIVNAPEGGVRVSVQLPLPSAMAADDTPDRPAANKANN